MVGEGEAPMHLQTMRRLREDAFSTRIGGTDNGKAMDRVRNRVEPFRGEKGGHPCACRLSAKRRGCFFDLHWRHQQREGNGKSVEKGRANRL
jgi:hypothetical protein